MAENQKTEDTKKEKQNNPTKEEPKERAVNPIAMRPEGIHVTINTTKEEVKRMAKKFGFF
jgi:hypothetical protein